MYGVRAFIASWWDTAADYQWTLRHLRSRGLLRLHQVFIGAVTLIYGLAALLSAAWSQFEGGRVLGAKTGVLIIAVGAAVMALLWIFGPAPSEGLSTAFVVIADVSVVVVMSCYADSYTAMPGLVLLACNGVYVIVLHGPRGVLGHVAYSTLALIYFYAMAMHQSYAPATVVTVRALTLLPTVVLLPIVAQSYLLSLQSGAVDSLHDPLTRVCNRRGMDYYLDDMTSGMSADISAVAVDIDRFKSINDKYGHGAGDRILLAIANAMRDIVATGNFAIKDAVLGRTGGEEFIAVMRGGRDTGAWFAERLHHALYRCDDEVTPTVSIGLATGRPAELASLIQRADSAMYEAKFAGGAQTVDAGRGRLDAAPGE